MRIKRRKKTAKHEEGEEDKAEEHAEVNAIFTPADFSEFQVGADSRRVMLPIHAAHAHLTQHAKRLALNPIEPVAVTEPDAPEIDDTDLPSDLVERLETTLAKMSQRLMITPHGLRLYSQTLKILEETKARRTAAERNLTPEDATKMLRSLGEVYVDHIQHHVPHLADHLQRKVREWCGVNLMDYNVAIAKLMEAETCVWANAVMDAMEKCVKDQCNSAREKSSMQVTCKE